MEIGKLFTSVNAASEYARKNGGRIGVIPIDDGNIAMWFSPFLTPSVIAHLFPTVEALGTWQAMSAMFGETHHED